MSLSRMAKSKFSSSRTGRAAVEELVGEDVVVVGEVGGEAGMLRIRTVLLRLRLLRRLREMLDRENNADAVMDSMFAERYKQKHHASEGELRREAGRCRWHIFEEHPIGLKVLQVATWNGCSVAETVNGTTQSRPC